MKWSILCLVISIFIFGCTDVIDTKANSDSRAIKIIGSFKLSPFADSFLREYISILPNQPAYALFIDEKSEQRRDFVLTIAPFNNAITNFDESGAVCYFMLEDSTPIFIYSGLEDFVSGSPVFEKSKKRPEDVPAKGEFKYFDPVRRKVNFLKARSLVQNDSLRYIIEGNSFPFVNFNILPTRYFFETKE